MPEVRVPVGYYNHANPSSAAPVFSPNNRRKGSNSGKPFIPAQASQDAWSGILQHDSGLRWNPIDGNYIDFNKMRLMRRDPTISLAREIAIAPIMASEWSVEIDSGVDDWGKTYIEDYVLPLRSKFMRTALLGEIDFGWRAYEQVLAHYADKKLGDVIYTKVLRALRNDNTWVRYTKYGEYDGLIHLDPNYGQWYLLDVVHSLFVNFDDDGLGNYATPRLMRSEQAYDEWNNANDAAARYDQKVAGAVWVIQYPEAKSMYKGARVNNDVIAREIASQIRASGEIVMPSTITFLGKDDLDALGQPGWKIFLLEASGSHQTEFIERLAYCDVLKVRGLGLLERSVLEGQYGTKAEAGVHSNTTTLNMELKHKDITTLINSDLVDQMLEVNRPDLVGYVRLVAQPLSEERQGAFQELLLALLQSDETARADALAEIDLVSVLNVLKVPVMSDAEKAEKESASANDLFNMLRGVGNVLQNASAPGASHSTIGSVPESSAELEQNLNMVENLRDPTGNQ